jgi:hypothetical protein
MQAKLGDGSMQSGVDVGAGAGAGEGVLDVEEDDIPSASTSATSLITPRTERFSRRRLVGSVFRGRWCVRPFAFVYPD